MNEPNYLGKAIHFWDPAWAQNDFFLGTGRYALGLLFHLRLAVAVAGAGGLGMVRPAADLGPAGLGVAAIEFRRGAAALAAPVDGRLVVALIQHGNLAGEWLIGGVEAKGFAFVLVLLGLEALALGAGIGRGCCLGAASAFHVLVGGWVAVAAGMASS